MRSTSSPRAVSMMTGTLRLLAEAAQDLEAVDAGEHDVEHDQVDAGCRGVSPGRGCLHARFHGKAFAAQELAQQGGEFGVVIDQQDVHGSNLPRMPVLGLPKASAARPCLLGLQRPQEV